MSPVKGRKSLSKGDSAPSVRNVVKNIPLAAVQSLNKSPKEETPKTRKLLSTSNTPCPNSDKPQKRKRSKGEKCGAPPESPGKKKLIVESADASVKAVPKSPPIKSEQNSKAITPCAKKGDKKLKFSRASKQKNSKSVRKNVGNEVLQAGEKGADKDETVEQVRGKLKGMTRTSNLDKQETKRTITKTILDIRDEDDESDEDFEVTREQLEEESEDLEEEYDDTDEGDFGNDEGGDNKSSTLKTALNILSVELNSDDDDDDEEWNEEIHIKLRCEDEIEEEESVEEDNGEEEEIEEEEESVEEDNDEEEEIEEEEENGEEIDEDGSSETVDLEDKFDDTILLASSAEEEEPDQKASVDECEEDDEEIPQLVAMSGKAAMGREALSGRKSVLIKNLPHNVTLAGVKEFIVTQLPMAVVCKYKLLPKRQAVIDFLNGTHKHALLLNGRKYKSQQLLVQLLPPQKGGVEAKGASSRGSKWQPHLDGCPSKLPPPPVEFQPSEAPGADSSDGEGKKGSPSKGHERNGQVNGKQKKSPSPERAEDPDAATVPAQDHSARSQLQLVVCGLPTQMPAEKVKRKLCGLLGTAGRVLRVQVLAGVPGSFHVSIATMEDLNGFRSALRMKNPHVGEHGVDISSGRLAAPLLQMLAEQRASRVQGASRGLQTARGGLARTLRNKRKKNKRRSGETAV